MKVRGRTVPRVCSTDSGRLENAWTFLRVWLQWEECVCGGAKWGQLEGWSRTWPKSLECCPQKSCSDGAPLQEFNPMGHLYSHFKPLCEPHRGWTKVRTRLSSELRDMMVRSCWRAVGAESRSSCCNKYREGCIIMESLMNGFRLLGSLGHLHTAMVKVLCMCLCVSVCVAMCIQSWETWSFPGRDGCGRRRLGGSSEMVPDCRVCFEFLLYEPVLALRHGNNL